MRGLRRPESRSEAGETTGGHVAAIVGGRTAIEASVAMLVSASVDAGSVVAGDWAAVAEEGAEEGLGDVAVVVAAVVVVAAAAACLFLCLVREAAVAVVVADGVAGGLCVVGDACGRQKGRRGGGLRRS